MDYTGEGKDLTLQDVHLKLVWNEMQQLAAGCAPCHKVTLMGFFGMGFDIEDQQYVLISCGVHHSLTSQQVRIQT